MRNIGPARLALLAAAMVIAGFLGRPSPALGALFTVNATHDAVDASPGDGVCADAGGACTLRAAVMETNALPGADEISLPLGTYALSIPGLDEENSASGDLDVTDDVVIGAPLIVDGTAEPTGVIDGAALDRVFDVKSGAKLSLRGVIVQGGAANGSPGFGGGVRNLGELTLQDGAVRANSAPFFGGGIFSGANSVTSVARSSITGNMASEGGGLFTVSGADVSVAYGLIDGNSAIATGGGIANGGFATTQLSNSRLTGNTAASGGGLANYGTADVTATSIIGNRATPPGAAGIQSGGGALTVTNTTIANNSGVALTNGGTQPTEPVPNTVADLVNVTISGNDGAAIANRETGELRASNITAAFNRSGVANQIPGAVTLFNTIVAFNDPDGDCSGAITSAGHNLDSDGTCALSGPGDLSWVEEAGLLPLADNGGPTQTHALILGGCQGDACVFGSIAIDAGDNNGCPAADQRGVPRPQNGDGRDGVVCDIGAFELEGPPPQPCPAGQACPSVGPVTPSPSVSPASSPVLPAAVPETGGRPRDDGVPLVAALAAFPALAAAAALSWRMLRRR